MRAAEEVQDVQVQTAQREGPLRCVAVGGFEVGAYGVRVVVLGGLAAEAWCAFGGGGVGRRGWLGTGMRGRRGLGEVGFLRGHFHGGVEGPGAGAFVGDEGPGAVFGGGVGVEVGVGVGEG